MRRFPLEISIVRDEDGAGLIGLSEAVAVEQPPQPATPACGCQVRAEPHCGTADAGHLTFLVGRRGTGACSPPHSTHRSSFGSESDPSDCAQQTRSSAFTTDTTAEQGDTSSQSPSLIRPVTSMALQSPAARSHDTSTMACILRFFGCAPTGRRTRVRCSTERSGEWDSRWDTSRLRSLRTPSNGRREDRFALRDGDRTVALREVGGLVLRAGGTTSIRLIERSGGAPASPLRGPGRGRGGAAVGPTTVRRLFARERMPRRFFDEVGQTSRPNRRSRCTHDAASAYPQIGRDRTRALCSAIQIVRNMG